jgi:hypothetical protein
MSTSLSRRKILTLVSTAGISFLAGCQGLTTTFGQDILGSQEKEGTSNKDLGITYSKSSGSPFPSEDDSQNGWIHIVSDGESADLTFDIRFCSTVGDVEPDLSNSSGDEYILRFNSSADHSAKSLPDDSIDESTCDSVIHLVGGANIPNGWGTLLVYVNNAEIQSIEKSGTMPGLYSHLDPIQFKY